VRRWDRDCCDGEAPKRRRRWDSKTATNTRLVRPGGKRKIPSFLVAIPFLIIMFLAAISLGFALGSHWDRMIKGDHWLECLVSIPIIAIVPLRSRLGRPEGCADSLTRTGAFAGLIAGGVSAMAYALHCTDDSLPFVAVWYGGTIVLCTLAGAASGPRLLRWKRDVPASFTSA
jgi:hypothetical protein